MEAFYSKNFVLPLPAGHRFPMEKYRLIHAGVQAIVPTIQCQEAPSLADDVLALVHHQDYIKRVSRGILSPTEQRATGFPCSSQILERSRRSVGATVAAAYAGMRYGVAVNLAGAHTMLTLIMDRVFVS